MLLNARLALRNLRKHRFFSAINLLGLGVGLTVFMFSVLFVRYEVNHDHMFAKRDQIVTVGSQFSPSSGEPISQYPNVRLAYGPLFQAQVPGILRAVRSKFERRKVHSARGAFHLGLRFVDEGFTDLFDFTYLYGSPVALSQPFTLALTASSARTLFGTSNAVGLTVLLDQRWPLRVVAVFEDVAVDSHFNSSLMPDVELTSFTSLSTLIAMSEFTAAGEWESLEPTDLTYLLLPEGADLKALRRAVNAIAERYASAQERAYISALNIRPLQDHHTQVWDSLGFPVNETLTLMGLLVLLAAALNYASLASLQHAGRAREWGLRKAFGAKPYQLVRQLLLESVMLVAVATWLAFALVEILVPLFNAWSGKSITIEYVSFVPELVCLVVLLGLGAGIYPAMQAANYGASDALRRGLAGSTLLGRGRVPWLRQLLVAGQFSIATYILALVAVVVLQNNHLQRVSDVFIRDRVLILSDMTAPILQPKLAAFQQALEKIPGLEATSGSESVPYLRVGGSSFLPNAEVELLLGQVAPNFFSFYQMPLLDKLDDGQVQQYLDDNFLPVIINQMAAELLGVSDVDHALGHRYQARVDGRLRDYVVVGVMPTQYFLGVHMRKRPIAFAINRQPYNYWAVKFSAPITERDLKNVHLLWRQYFPSYPISVQPLDHYFNRFFKIPTMIGKVISVFAAIAALLAIIGLLGLVVFAARQREQELALRKVFGARWVDLVLLLARPFTLPVLSSLLLALPLAYVSSHIYLQFFPEQLAHPGLVTVLSGFAALAIAAFVLALQALIVANRSAGRGLQKV
ncbi:ABC transporter permease [Simiduia curdlanivorans]|uniref:ABC transporter permease n=1 Tax=Simiduia curdlanivorans TaxID=1492769 RepID=A0ABV8V303_9GAMM|nr:ABC transporter permease [Simiduia curdlanivorans]MDN3637531.1 ABC transporter permease [Simiduia curdlanivorans]